MNSFLRSRSCRCCVCLILVLVLLISWSPIRVQAVGVDQFIGVAVDKVGLYAQAGALSTGATVFAWVLVGLGIIVTTAQAIDLMNQYTEYSGELETAIYYYPDGSWSYGVDMGFVERVRAFLWKQGILVQNTELHLDPVSYPPADALAAAKNANYSLLVYYTFSDSGPYWHLAFSNVSQVVASATDSDGTGLYIRTTDSNAEIYSYDNSSGKFNKAIQTAFYGGSQYKIVNKQYFGQLIIPDVKITIDGAEIGVVAPPEVDIPTGYPEWHTNSRPATNSDTDEEITVLPIPLNPSADPETQIGTLTQPDIWQGSIADPMPDSPGAPSSDIGDYQIDLKKFFPFCIPFDLYDFFTCLKADPVAPVIEWVIPLPSGDTYPLEIDLSAFDGVAQLLRRLQLLLFCVGLAFKTRDLIKG